MRKVTLGVLMLVIFGSFGAAWLSSSTSGLVRSSIDEDIVLWDDSRAPGAASANQAAFPRAGLAGSSVAIPPSEAPELQGTLVSAATPGGTAAIAGEYQRPGYRPTGGSFGRSPVRNGGSSSGGYASIGAGGGGLGGGSVTGGGAPQPRVASAGTTSRTPRQPAQRQPAQRSPRASNGGGGSRSGSGGGAGSGPVSASITPNADISVVAPSAGRPSFQPDGSWTPKAPPGGSPSSAPTPEPATMLLLGSGLAGLYGLRRYLA